MGCVLRYMYRHSACVRRGGEYESFDCGPGSCVSRRTAQSTRQSSRVYRCWAGGHGAEAFSTAVTLKPDLVLMDLAFEDASGWELLDGLIAKLPETNVVILTSQNTDEGLFEAIRRGARGYILKGLPWEK